MKVQYNLPSKTSPTGFNTIFHLRGPKGDAVLYPDVDFWMISIRFDPRSRFNSYVGLLAGHREGLAEFADVDTLIERQRKLLIGLYSSLEKA